MYIGVRLIHRCMPNTKKEENRVRKKKISLSALCRLLIAVLTIGLLMCMSGCGKQADEDEASATVEEKVKKLTKAVKKGKADKYLEESHAVEVDGDDWDNVDWDTGDDDSDGQGDEGLDGIDLSGFDDGGNAGADEGDGLNGTHEDLGYYYMYTYSDGEEVYYRDDLEESGVYFSLMLNGDGTGYWYVLDDRYDLTWEDGTLYVQADNGIETVTYYVSGDYIVIADNEESFTFEYSSKPDITD